MGTSNFPGRWIPLPPGLGREALLLEPGKALTFIWDPADPSPLLQALSCHSLLVNKDVSPLLPAHRRPLGTRRSVFEDYMIRKCTNSILPGQIQFCSHQKD